MRRAESPCSTPAKSSPNAWISTVGKRSMIALISDGFTPLQKLKSIYFNRETALRRAQVKSAGTSTPAISMCDKRGQRANKRDKDIALTSM